MSGERPDPNNESEEIQRPITVEEYYRNQAEALKKEHTDAFLSYRDAAQSGSKKLNDARQKLDEVEAKMAIKADEAERSFDKE